jgi:geranylgeranyl reductase family protein
MKIYDVIISGAGPAGSLAAYHLAAAGRKVLLLDKARFPRRKVCGGGLTEHGLRQIPFDISPLIHQTITWGYLGFRGREVCAIHDEQPIARLIDRSSFDDYLRQQAVSQGAECHQGERVTGITQSSDRVAVQTNQSTYEARFAIGADGIHSIVAKQLGLMAQGSTSLATEARLALPADRQGTLTDGITFDFGTLPWGYGWIFPKRDHLNVGVFRNWPGTRTSREQLLRFIRQHPGLDESQILDIRAYPGPTGGTRGPRHRGRILLAGDAAHLADPWLGEGITYALASGRIAAETLLGIGSGAEPDLSTYSNRIDREILTEFRAARKMAVLVSSSYGLNVRLLKRSATLQGVIIDLLRGDLSYTKLWADLSRHIPRALYKTIAGK